MSHSRINVTEVINNNLNKTNDISLYLEIKKAFIEGQTALLYFEETESENLSKCLYFTLSKLLDDFTVLFLKDNLTIAVSWEENKMLLLSCMEQTILHSYNDDIMDLKGDKLEKINDKTIDILKVFIHTLCYTI